MDGKKGGTRTGRKEKYLTAWEVSNCKKRIQVFLTDPVDNPRTSACSPPRCPGHCRWTSVLPSHVPSSGALATSAALQDPSTLPAAAAAGLRCKQEEASRMRAAASRGRRLRLGPGCSGWWGRPAPGRPRPGRGAASAWAADGGVDGRGGGGGQRSARGDRLGAVVWVGGGLTIFFTIIRTSPRVFLKYIL